MGAALCLPADVHLQQPPVQVAVNLNDPRPRPEELQLYKILSQLLAPSSNYLNFLQNYQDCGEAIRAAISRPSIRTEDAVWHVLIPNILQLKVFYEYSLQIENAFPRALLFLSNIPDTVTTLETFEATTKRICDILHFVSLFDELKVNNSNIQNEFSYYRRALQKSRMAGEKQGLPSLVLDAGVANAMSMFYAQPTPMLKMLVDCCRKPFKGISQEKTVELFATIAAGCYHAVLRKEVQGEMVEYALRVLVMCIILYDHLDNNESGAFAKSSRIDIKSYIRLIQGNAQEPLSTNLWNAVRYSTVHLNDESTPTSLKDFVNDLR